MAADGKNVADEVREEYSQPRKVSVASAKDVDAARHGDRALAIMYGSGENIRINGEQLTDHFVVAIRESV